MFVPFAKPSIGPAEIAAVVESLESGWLSSGPKVLEFEDKFSNFLGIETKNVASVNSATAGLHLALESLGASAGMKIVMPTMTFTATAEVARYFGAEITLVDSESTSPNMDLGELSITKDKCDLVIPVHFGGIPVNITKLKNIVGSETLILEDAAHAFPAKLENRFVGNLDSDACVFSFYANKTMTTGEGGMVTSKNEELISRVKTMRSHGLDKNVFARFQGKDPSLSDYDVIAAGYKYNLTDPAAALGIVQLSRASEMKERRKAIYKYYVENLATLPIKYLDHGLNAVESAYHLFTIEMQEESRRSRDGLVKWLHDKGIMTSRHYKPLHLMTYWKNTLDLTNRSFPNANKRYLSTISLPYYSDMTDLQVEYVASKVKEYFF